MTDASDLSPEEPALNEVREQSLEALTGSVLTQPSPAVLRALQAELLAMSDTAHLDATEAALEVAGEFFVYLTEVQSKTTAREYNRLASLFDLGSLGALAVENLLSEQQTTLKNLLLSGLSESLMVLGSLQYIKAWEREVAAAHARAAWFLTGALWRLSAELQPELPADRRRALIDALVAPALAEETPTETRVALVGRLFQVVLASWLLRLTDRALFDR
jgi:hypothetical protein